ncbi:MAG: hypothetical protein JWM44_755 [Bacilli bacterium]|nr:hypothetical protein [Bacilli bacterium]
MKTLLQQILTEIKEVKSSINRIEKKLDSKNEQVVKNSEAINIMINGQNKGEHQFQAFNNRYIQ